MAEDFNNIVSASTAFFLSFISLTYINNPVVEIFNLGALLAVLSIFLPVSALIISFYKNIFFSFFLSIAIIIIIFILSSSSSSAIASISIALATVGLCQLYVLFASR